MTLSRFFVGLTFLAMLLLPHVARAGLFRTYLSANGSDANPCTVQQPCRLLPAALAAVNNGGEVWMVDSANYNTATVVVNKSVTILAVPGAVGSIVGNGADAIFIATLGVDVSLRNLKIVNLLDGGNGITMTNGRSLTVEGCVISGFKATSRVGIRIIADTRAIIIDTTIRDNYIGVWFDSGARGTVSRSTVAVNVLAGIQAQATIAATTAVATVSDTIAVGNGIGFYVSSAAPTTAKMTISRSTASNNVLDGFALDGGTGTMVVSGSTSSHNGANGFANFGGTFRSLVDNIVFDNGTDTFGTITASAPK